MESLIYKLLKYVHIFVALPRLASNRQPSCLSFPGAELEALRGLLHKAQPYTLDLFWIFGNHL